MPNDKTPAPPAIPAAKHLIELFDSRTGKIYRTLRANYDPSKHVRAKHRDEFLAWCDGVGDWPPGSGGNVRFEPIDPKSVVLPLPTRVSSVNVSPGSIVAGHTAPAEASAISQEPTSEPTVAPSKGQPSKGKGQ